MRFLLAVILLVFSGFCVHAQTVKPIRWTLTLSKENVKQGETIEIVLKADINADWYLYSSDFDPNLGPMVSTVSFENNGSFKLVGPLKPVGAKEKYDSLWEGKVTYFIKHAEFRQKIKILKTNPVVKGVLMYQVCSDKEGKCIPYEEPILFNKLKVTAAEIAPEKQLAETSQTEAPSKTEKEPVLTEKESASSGDQLTRLEAEKAKLVQKDSKGNDSAIRQLKAFAQKYGGDK